MRRNHDVVSQGLSLPPPTPPPPVIAAVGSGMAENSGGDGSSVTPSSSSKGSLNPSLLIISLILMAVLIFSVLLHLLLRYLSRSSSTTSRSSGDGNQDSVDHSHHAHRISSRRVSPEYQSLIDSLPLFSFDSVTGLKSSSTVDCAVCLSKLEPHDKLRLLPLCCHAFHAECIDTWLASSHTCPLCRSTIHVNESEEFAKLTSMSAAGGGDSFRLEIGSISRRNSAAAADSGGIPNSRRSYSIGSFDYVLEDDSEVMVAGSNYRQGGSENNLGRKDRNGLTSQDAINVAVPEPPGDQVATGVASGGRSWLKDYVDRLASSASTSFSSRTQSFRYSGRFFTGSSRRNDLQIGSGRRSSENAVAGAGEVGSWDLEGNWVSEEMSGFFRWLSGV